MPKSSLELDKKTEATRFEVVRRLRVALFRKNLVELARLQGVTIRRGNRLNKGWVGVTVEKMAKVVGGNLQQRDGVDFELKTTSLILDRYGHYVPKETLCITQINPAALLRETFPASALWNKLSRLIIVGCVHESPDIVRVHSITPVDVSDQQLITHIRDYWLMIKRTAAAGELGDYSSRGTSDGYIQVRPKGDGIRTIPCPVTGRRIRPMAFYATKNFIKYSLGLL